MTTEDDKLKREEATGFFQQAYELQMKGRLEEALELYTRSIEAHPTAEAYTFRGWTYSFMGKIEEAIQECLQAIAVGPTFGNPTTISGRTWWSSRSSMRPSRGSNAR